MQSIGREFEVSQEGSSLPVKVAIMQDCYQQGLVEFHQTKTEHMTADLFMKALPKNDHWRHTKTLLAELPTKVIEELCRNNW